MVLQLLDPNLKFFQVRKPPNFKLLTAKKINIILGLWLIYKRSIVSFGRSREKIV